LGGIGAASRGKSGSNELAVEAFPVLSPPPTTYRSTGSGNPVAAPPCAAPAPAPTAEKSEMFWLSSEASTRSSIRYCPAASLGNRAGSGPCRTYRPPGGGKTLKRLGACLSQRNSHYCADAARGVAFPEFRKCHARARKRGYTSRAASQAALSVTNDQTRTDMESNSLMEESLARAFQLAYFIHGDRETALNIAAEALAKLEVAAAAQDKRLYYTPTGRAARAE